MIRKNGKLERATWDEAMGLVARKAQETREKLTAHGIAFYTSGQLFLEEYYVLAMIGKAGLNTLHMDGNTRLCTATAAASMRESFGSDGQPGSYTDIDVTDCIFMVGHNMAATQTVLWSRILDRLAGQHPPKLIVIDPRLSDSAKQATVHLAARIGTNMAVLNGIQHLLFENCWVDEDFVQKHTVGVEELREKVKMYTPEYVEEITNVPQDQLREAARIIGTSESLLSTCLQGVYQSNQATASACQVNNINLLRGCIGKPGSGIYQMNGQPTAQNNREAGCDGEFPGFRNPLNPSHMQELADCWNIDYDHVPHWAQPTHVENILNYVNNGSIQFMWVSGTNPLVSLPNLQRTRDIFTKEGLFLVVQDIFPTETTELADVVLPAAQWAEKQGCFTNVDRTVHLSHKAVDPPGEARSDFDIFMDFARRMDFRGRDGEPLMPFNNAEDAFNAWRRLSRGRPCDYSGLSYDKLTGGSGIQWPCNAQYPNGKERLFEDGVFFTDIEYCESYGHDLETGTPITKMEYQKLSPNGRAIFKACHYIESFEVTNEDYPLQLSTGRNVYHFHTRTKTGRSKPLQEAFSEPIVRINEGDAADLDIEDGEEVVIKSRRGAVQMKAKLGRISKGQIFIPFHFGYFDAKDSKSRAANELTIEGWDPVSKQPTLKAGAVRIEKCTDPKTGNADDGVHAKETQTATKDAVARSKPNAHDVGDDRQRQRHLELWLGTTFQSIKTLQEVFKSLITSLIHDREVQGGLRVVERINQDSLDKLAPYLEKYKPDNTYGHEISPHLAKSLFPNPNADAPQGPYEALFTLTGVLVYMSNVEAHLQALGPVAQAMWDGGFLEAVRAAQTNTERVQKW